MHEIMCNNDNNTPTCNKWIHSTPASTRLSRILASGYKVSKQNYDLLQERKNNWEFK